MTMFDPNKAPEPRPDFPAAPFEAAPKADKKARFARKPKTAKAAKAPKSANQTHKVMIGGAIAAGLFAVLLVLTAGGNDTPEETFSFVARTTVQKDANLQIVAADLEIKKVSPSSVEIGAISATTPAEVQALLTENILGRYTVAPLSIGEQIHVTDFGSDAALAVELLENERIVSVSASVGNAAGGVLTVGDHVDVIATGRNSDNQSVTVIAVQDVVLVAVRPSEQIYSAIASAQNSEAGRDIDPNELLPGEPVPGLYLLKVSVEDALRLTAAGSDSDLTLAYRAPEAHGVVSEAGAVVVENIFDASN